MRETGTSPALTGLAVLVGGFGVMNLWWWATPGDGRDQLPGLYDYYSAVWGDGLLLPIAAAALVALLGKSEVAVAKWQVVALAGAGALAGAAVQAGWLADPEPRLNWTIPQPHHFTAAGWYHAAFFTVMSGVFTALLGVLAIRTHKARAGVEAPACTVFVLAATGFAALVVRDGLEAPLTSAQLATWGGVAIAVVAAIAVLTRQPALVALRRVPGVLAWVVAVFVATTLVAHYRITLLGVVVTGVCVALVLGLKGQRLTVVSAAQVVTVVFVCTTWMSFALQQWPTNLAAALLAPVAAMAAAVAVLFGTFHLEVEWADVLFVGVHLLVVVDVGLYLTTVGLVVDQLLFTTVLATASFLQVTLTRQLTNVRYRRLIRAENDDDKAGLKPGEGTARTVAVEVWTWALGTYLAALVAVVTMTIGAVITKGFQPGGSSERLRLTVLASGALFACASAWVTARLAKDKRETRSGPTPSARPGSAPDAERTDAHRPSSLVYLPAMVGIACWLAILMSSQPFPHRFYYAPWAVVAAVIMGLVTWESVRSNVLKLNNVDKADRLGAVPVVAVGLGLLAAVNTYWLMAGVASGQGTAESTLRALVAVLLVVAVQLNTLVCVGFAAQAQVGSLRTRYATWFNLFQDGALFLGLVVVFGFIPLFVYRHLEPLSLRRSWESALALGPTLTFVGALLTMTLKNNFQHYDAKKKIHDAAAGKDYQGMPIDALKSHIAFQNRMAVALAATTVVGLANAVQDVEDLRQAVLLEPTPRD